MGKRLFDLIVATLALVILSPVMAIVAVMVRVCLGKPILHRATRPGLDERLFEMVKFRSMSNAVDASGALLSDEERTGPFGHWLRRSSFDELPELWNVLKGDMSLVGPRPLLTQYLAVYSPEQRQRHLVRPGITGWAQINGRNAISWEEKFALDLWYVRNRSFRLDMIIIARTIAAVLRRENISAAGYATMPVFTGSEPNSVAVRGEAALPDP